MSYLAESWDHIARALGYENEREMLVDLYEVQEMGLHELARALGYSHGNVRRRLLMNGIEMRTRGGPQRGPTKMFAELPDEEFKQPEKLAKRLGVSVSCIYNEKRRRKLTKWSSVQSSQLNTSTDSAESSELTLCSPNTPEDETNTSTGTEPGDAEET